MAEKTTVAPRDAGKESSDIMGPTEGESTVVMDASANRCIWNDQEFADGDLVECDGETYECTFGRWAKVD